MATGIVKGSEYVLLKSSDRNITIATGSRVTTLLSAFVTIPSGYEIASVTPIITGSGTGYCDVHVNGYDGDNDVPAIIIHNGYTASVTAKTRVYVLLRKT